MKPAVQPTSAPPGKARVGRDCGGGGVGGGCLHQWRGRERREVSEREGGWERRWEGR